MKSRSTQQEQGLGRSGHRLRAIGQSRSVTIFRRISLVGMALVLLVPSMAFATSGPGLSTASFNESSGCDDPAGYHGPRTTRTGYLPDSEPLYGPLADTFGRTIGQIKNQLVWWTVPMSGGHRVLVHSLALPAFQQVTANLDAAAADGKWYTVVPSRTYGFVQRTIGGRYSVSFHAFGTAIDINSHTNPYRGDGALITNMPAWYVEAWTSAGFCWGGDWQEVKDPMHFAWKGPAYTPGYPIDLVDKAPSSSSANWTTAISSDLAWSETHDAAYFLRDGNRDGAVDVYRLRSWAGGTLIELSRSSKDYAVCGAWREWSPTPAGGPVLLADYDNTSRLDLWALDLSGATLRADVWLHRDDFESSVSQSTGIPVSNGMRVEAADFNDDGSIDLAIGRPGSPTAVEIWSGASGFTSLIASSSVSVATTDSTLLLSAADIDRDDLPDLAVIAKSGQSARVVVVSSGSGLATQIADVNVSSSAPLVDVAFGEYDGDGRRDIATLDTAGRVKAFLGGALPGSVVLSNWFRDPQWTCPDDDDVDLPDEVDVYIPRISGYDRYSTSANVSAQHFSPGTDTVIVASGLDFPDALAAAPVAASLGGPVLLTHRDWLPGSVADEITRLGASRIIIAGGTGAVSPAVEQAIAALPSVATVERAAGLDRYGTAAELAALIPNPDVVYVATGANYPDALASAPAAASEGAPILLVAPTGIPGTTRAALDRIGWVEIVVLGGTGAVPQFVANQLGDYGNVTRVAGPDRYATAVAVAQRMPAPSSVVVVSGQGFADAVGAGAAAAVMGAPMILATTDYLPSPSGNYLAGLRTSHITVIGGWGAVSEVLRANLIELVYPD